MTSLDNLRVGLLVSVSLASDGRHVFLVVQFASTTHFSLHLTQFLLKLLNHVMLLVHIAQVGIGVALCSQLVEVLLLGAFLSEHFFAH